MPIILKAYIEWDSKSVNQLTLVNLSKGRERGRMKKHGRADDTNIQCIALCKQYTSHFPESAGPLNKQMCYTVTKLCIKVPYGVAKGVRTDLAPIHI